MKECCETCKNKYKLMISDYSNGGCKDSFADNGYACSIFSDEGVIVFMIGNDPETGMCEGYTPKGTYEKHKTLYPHASSYCGVGDKNRFTGNVNNTNDTGFIENLIAVARKTGNDVLIHPDLLEDVKEGEVQ